MRTKISLAQNALGYDLPVNSAFCLTESLKKKQKTKKTSHLISTLAVRALKKRNTQFTPLQGERSGKILSACT